MTINEKQVARPTESLARRFGRGALMELPVWQLLFIAASVGAIWAASLFDWSFITGQDAFWQFPEGTIGGSQNDMAIPLAAYLYYVRSPWHLSLFHVAALGAPVGVNVIFTDVVPIIALIGKMIHSLTGATVNLYGGWLFLCFVLPGVMMTLLLIAAKIRYGLAAVIAAIFANALPALLWRWGHIALEGQFLLIGALALYLFSLNKPTWRSVTAIWTGYLILAYLTSFYLFAMVGIVWLCGIIQRRLNERATTRETLRTGVWGVVAVLIVMTFSGQFGGRSGPPFSTGYGLYSLNLLSPFVPQKSGLLPSVGGLIDATGGQYEGFNYLGLGLLLATFLLLPAEVAWLRRNLRRHVALLVGFAVLTAFAISNCVYVGHWLLFKLPLPRYIIWALGIFRGSGRFFWLIGYAQLAIALVLGFRRAKPMTALFLVGAAILQVFDVQPLRAQIIASIAAGPGAEVLPRAEIARLVAGAHYVEAVPSFQCSVGRDQKVVRANVELTLAVARINVPTNTAFSARHFGLFGVALSDILRAPSRSVEMLTARRDQYCDHEIKAARGDGRPGDVIVLLSDRPRTDAMAAGVACSPLGWARYCERSTK